MDNQKEIKKLLEFFTQLTFVDIMAFGNILNVKEVDPFEDYVTNIVDQFQKQTRIKRRQLMKLAKDVAKANRELEKEKEKGKN